MAMACGMGMLMLLYGTRAAVTIRLRLGRREGGESRSGFPPACPPLPSAPSSLRGTSHLSQEQRVGCCCPGWDPVPRAADPVAEQSFLSKLLCSEVPAPQARLCQHCRHRAREWRETLGTKFHVNHTLFAPVTGYYLLQEMRGETAAGCRQGSPDEDVPDTSPQGRPRPRHAPPLLSPQSSPQLPHLHLPGGSPSPRRP